MESYHNACTGKYGYVQLTTRYKDVAMPEIRVVDTKDLYRRKMMRGGVLARLARGDAHGAQQQEAGAAVPEPPRLCAYGGVQGVRMGA